MISYATWLNRTSSPTRGTRNRLRPTIGRLRLVVTQDGDCSDNRAQVGARCARSLPYLIGLPKTEQPPLPYVTKNILSYVKSRCQILARYALPCALAFVNAACASMDGWSLMLSSIGCSSPFRAAGRLLAPRAHTLSKLLPVQDRFEHTRYRRACA